MAKVFKPRSSTGTLRVATYHRCSTKDQKPDLVRDELRQAAARLGELTMEVEETGSGRRNDRPGLQQVLDAARHGKLDVVIVWKLDRFARSTIDLLSNIRELVEVHGVRFVAVTQGLDVRPGGDAMSRFLLTVLGAVAEFERELISERTIAGMAHAKRQGTHIGRPRIPGRPGHAQVKAMRKRGLSWSKVSEELHIPMSTARRIAAGA